MKKPPKESEKTDQAANSEPYGIEELDLAIEENEELKEAREEARSYVHFAFEQAAKQDLMARKLLVLIHTIRHSADLFLEEGVAKREGIACAAGCNFCCHMRVSASPLEVFTLAATITKSWPLQEIESLRETLRKNVERMRTLNTEGHFRAKIPCPLLKNGKCSAYEYRPLNCRKWFSYSKEKCETDFKGELVGKKEISAQGYLFGRVLAAGISEWLKHRGLDNDEYELQSSLLIALDKFETINEWMGGERVFADSIRPGWKGVKS